MIPVSISKELRTKVSGLTLSCIECDVTIREDADVLWNIILQKTCALQKSLQVGQISGLPAIATSRIGYKACGKDPARYRLSAESLLRRVVQGKGLYRVNNVVDLLNLVSITTGFSIGGYDADKIEGDVEFGIGYNQEPYQGIGRGELNIECIPVFRDKRGAFGTPTSDSMRTAVTLETQRFLMIIIDFGTQGLLDEAVSQAVSLLREYAAAKNLESWKVEGLEITRPG